MIGPRVGIRVGVNIGAAVGVSADELGGGAANPMAGVTRDATSLIYCPANATEWTTTLSVAGLAGGNPLGLWNCQDASGNLADSIGSQALTVTGVFTYQAAAAGWTRKVITIAGGTNKAIAPAGYADASATSVAWLAYLFMTVTPGGNRNVMVLSDSVANGIRIDHVATAKLTGVDVANTGTTVSNYTGTALFPLLMVFDRTHSTCTFYTALEAKTITFNGTITDGTKGIGAVVATADASANFGYLAAFTGGAAEQLTTAGARSLFTTLGWGPLF